MELLRLSRAPDNRIAPAEDTKCLRHFRKPRRGFVCSDGEFDALAAPRTIELFRLSRAPDNGIVPAEDTKYLRHFRKPRRGFVCSDGEFDSLAAALTANSMRWPLPGQ